MQSSKRILVAPLNWGLGHTTRCIPIINALLSNGHQVFLASDGIALALLEKEFPKLPSFRLPAYKITYAKKGKHFKGKLLWDSPKVLKAMAAERKTTKRLVKALQLDGIISDNRLGVYSKKVPCVFITHQLNVLSGNTTWLSSKLHQKIIQKYTVCWVPDVDGIPNLTGKLGHPKKSKLNIRYLGPISRFVKKEIPKKYDLMVLLSGPEPQRTLLEEKLLAVLQDFQGDILFVKGKIGERQTIEQKVLAKGQLTIINFMQSESLETAINSSELVLCRSGYTTVMDLAKLGKKAFFIPTPGQYEQLYLAKRLDKKGIVPYCKQKEFELSQLARVSNYQGLEDFGMEIDYAQLFSAFSKVKENSEPTSTSLST